MPSDTLDRRLFVAGLLAFALTSVAQAQHTDETHTDHASGGGGRGGSGGHSSGGQRGRPTDPHGEDDEHSDDHGDDHGDEHEDDHGDDHASGKKGKGPRYKGGRETVSVGVSHGRSLEDRVLKVPSF